MNRDMKLQAGTAPNPEAHPEGDSNLHVGLVARQVGMSPRDYWIRPRDPLDSFPSSPGNHFPGPLSRVGGTGDGKRMSNCSQESPYFFCNLARKLTLLGVPDIFMLSRAEINLSHTKIAGMDEKKPEKVQPEEVLSTEGGEVMVTEAGEPIAA